MTLPPAYSIPSRYSMYGPGAAGTLYQEGGVTDADLAMIEDVYSGAMASVDSRYCTEKYYQASPQGNWTRALEVCRFYSVKLGQIQLRYDPSGNGLCFYHKLLYSKLLNLYFLDMIIEKKEGNI